ncbi:MAG TPA: nitronate monooxygenase [Gemmatimonadales bacterium]|nr:nitronate monooxygenase [Gemmatimonadales bacterium]
MHTALCNRLGIALPIIQAPMAGGWTTPELAAAVSEAGGLGMLAGARLTADQLRSQIGETRRRTGRPFGVNFLLAPALPPSPDEQRAFALLDGIRMRLGLPVPAPSEAAGPAAVSPEEGLEIALAAGVRIISFAMGSPEFHAARVHASGALLLASITTVREAQRAADAGADVIVAQGAEAGGHRSTFEACASDALPLVGTMALVPAVVDAVAAPVVAAGGIMDGRGIAAALALGAGAAQLGTRFLLAHESGTPPAFRRRLLEAAETDTVVTDLFTGRAARGLRNAFVRAFAEEGIRPLPWPRQAAAAMDIYRASLADDGDWAPLFAGQGLRLATREQPAAEIVRELAAELERARNPTQ